MDFEIHPFGIRKLEKVFSSIINGESTDQILTGTLNILSQIIDPDFLIAAQIDNKLEKSVLITPDKYTLNEATKAATEALLPVLCKVVSVSKAQEAISIKDELLLKELKTASGCNSILLIPCFYEYELTGILFLGKKKEEFSEVEIQTIKEAAVFFAFTAKLSVSLEFNRELEARFNQKQRFETIGKLASGIAHDLSNVLSNIFGSLDLLKKKYSFEPNVEKLIANIESSSIRARELTRGFLSYGKPTAKQKETIVIKVFFEELEKAIAQTFPDEISFNVNVEEYIYKIKGNSTQLYQVILNMCINAKEAIRGKGSVTLNASNFAIDKSNHHKFPFLQEGNYVCISIEDTGSGISKENLDQIFDPYFSTKKKETVSGIGLYVSYGIIKAHKGHIEVSSTKGIGTKFDIFLPAAKDKRKETRDLSEKIILLADDEETLRDLLAELLEASNYSVIKVSGGDEVLKVLTEEIKADLLIIDHHMPGMSGLDCIREIKKLNYDFPIILSTGSLSSTANVNLKEENISAVIYKPYDFDELLKKINEIL